MQVLSITFWSCFSCIGCVQRVRGSRASCERCPPFFPCGRDSLLPHAALYYPLLLSTCVSSRVSPQATFSQFGIFLQESKWWHHHWRVFQHTPLWFQASLQFHWRSECNWSAGRFLALCFPSLRGKDDWKEEYRVWEEGFIECHCCLC